MKPLIHCTVQYIGLDQTDLILPSLMGQAKVQVTTDPQRYRQVILCPLLVSLNFTDVVNKVRVATHRIPLRHVMRDFNAHFGVKIAALHVEQHPRVADIVLRLIRHSFYVQREKFGNIILDTDHLFDDQPQDYRQKERHIFEAARRRAPHDI